MLRAIIASLILLACAAPAQAASQHPVRDTAAMIAPGAIVTCDSLPGLYGDSWPAEDGIHIRLSRPVCSGLARLAAHRVLNWANSANALETLLHERNHWPVGYPPDGEPEGVADCTALASMRYWLHRLGYTGAAVTRMLRAAWTIHDQLPSNYLGACVSPFDDAVPIVRP